MASGKFTYTPKFENPSQSVFAFYPKFQDFITLYRGVVRVWIGDGTNGEAGFLYAEYMDGVVQQLGFVSDYEKAKAYFAELGIDLSYEDWIRLMVAIPDKAAEASSAAQSATQKAQEAAQSATSAEQSKDDAETAKTAAETAQTHAETSEENAEAWAVGTIDGQPVPSTHVNYQNNSKYYSEAAHDDQLIASSAKDQASASASSASTSATAAETAKNASESAKTAAETANNSAQTAKTVAETARDNAKTYEEDAEAWAVGTRDGSPVPTTDETYQNNAKYYAGQTSADATSASNSALSASTSETNALSYKNDALTAKTAAETAQSLSEQWATGGTGAVPSASNNSKYYAEQAQQSAESASASASSASTSATNAGNSAVDAEGWATGGSGGTYSSTNNAKHYSDRAAEEAASIRDVTCQTSYQNSTSGVIPPEGTWSPTPTPVKGLYLWAKIDLNWGNGTTTTFYNISYIGSDGEGAVTSVNTKTGSVMLYAEDIEMSASNPTTISSMLQIATTQEIDDLFN